MNDRVQGPSRPVRPHSKYVQPVQPDRSWGVIAFFKLSRLTLFEGESLGEAQEIGDVRDTKLIYNFAVGPQHLYVVTVSVVALFWNASELSEIAADLAHDQAPTDDVNKPQ
ncbi:hypothetical protein C8Q76DRAFT_802766 [Earliella scabrosa]|nr:hypothetical protein C8Q76DRAFT_802766 [Earliella scabrosa]